jgi:predicted transcriptional regulator
MPQLKATDPADATSSIVVSFDAKWKLPLTHQQVSVVFRKRGPKSRELDWIYLYMSTPEGAIVGRGKVARYEMLPLKEALKLCPKALLTEKELGDYAFGYESLAVFFLANVQVAKTPLTLDRLAKEYEFKPPQSFIIMSKSGKRALDVDLRF